MRVGAGDLQRRCINLIRDAGLSALDTDTACQVPEYAPYGYMPWAPVHSAFCQQSLLPPHSLQGAYMAVHGLNHSPPCPVLFTKLGCADIPAVPCLPVRL